MQTSTLGNTALTVSRLGLGTAEVGFAYGIGPRSLPEEGEAIELLQKAVELGITFFDTANYYGESEARLGKSGILKNNSVVVETKCAQFLEKGETFSKEELEQKIRDQVHDSLQKMGVERLQILMLHGPSKEQIEEGTLLTIMQKLKSEGLIMHIGISARGEEASKAAVSAGGVEVVQVAYNILDQRMAKEVLPIAKSRGVGIINRSVLLKGSLTPLRTQLPKGLEPLQSQADEVEKVAQSLGMDLPTLAIRFAISNPLIASSLIGSNKIENIKKSIDACAVGPLPEDVLKTLYSMALTDVDQIDPAKWPPLK